MPNNEATTHASPGTATSHSSFIESKRVSGSDKFLDALVVTSSEGWNCRCFVSLCSSRTSADGDTDELPFR